MPSSPIYLTYVNFAENAVSFFCKLIPIFFMSRLIFCVQFRPHAVRISHLSASMYVYLGTHIIGSAISLPSVKSFKNELNLKTIILLKTIKNHFLR